jgi:hypothetical protein
MGNLRSKIRYRGILVSGPGCSVGIATDYGVDGPGIESLQKNPGGSEIFRKRPDWSWGPPKLFYKWYRSFLGIKRPGRGAYHPPPSSAEVENW